MLRLHRLIPLHWSIIGVCFLSLVALGCGSGPRRVGLEGDVSYRGRPIKQGTIQFEPFDAKNSYSAGAMIVDGHYSIPRAKGLLPGTYSVKISATEPKAPAPSPDGNPDGMLVVRELLPARYNMKTQLTEDVSASDPNMINFKLD
jgi:hypothetical protein